MKRGIDGILGRRRSISFELWKSKRIKRFIDITLAFFIMLLLSPVAMATGIAIWALMGSPILFTQVRPGYKAKPFKIRKFRTMVDSRDGLGHLLQPEKRITPLGRLIRALSLDEFPQLLNVLVGEMSLVGPRPLRCEYLPLYSPEQMRRHEVKPGITGWAQINGRNEINWDKKFELDVWYVDNWSNLIDLKIIIISVIKVFQKEGVNFKSGQVSCPFCGLEKF